MSKPSHGRIVQFSSSTGTLAYVPDENYNGKDDFAFKVHDGTAFSKDAKVSIKIENNEKSSNDQAKEVTSSRRKNGIQVKLPPMIKKPTMRRAITIRLQTIQANNLPLRLKTPNSRKRSKARRATV